MENKIKAIEEQIEKLRLERQKCSGEEHRSQKKILHQNLTMELIDKVIGDLENRKKGLSQTSKTPKDR